MVKISFNNVKLYDWVPYFLELSNKILEIGKLGNRISIITSQMTI
jgi:hypothetical protein